MPDINLNVQEGPVFNLNVLDEIDQTVRMSLKVGINSSSFGGPKGEDGSNATLPQNYVDLLDILVQHLSYDPELGLLLDGEPINTGSGTVTPGPTAPVWGSAIFDLDNDQIDVNTDTAGILWFKVTNTSTQTAAQMRDTVGDMYGFVNVAIGDNTLIVDTAALAPGNYYAHIMQDDNLDPVNSTDVVSQMFTIDAVITPSTWSTTAYDDGFVVQSSPEFDNTAWAVTAYDDGFVVTASPE